jgi:hypothetical protein
MLSSPKKQEYMSSLAPPGKRALYLGYANMPDGIGWVLGSLIAGATYEEKGDKINLCRDLLAEHAAPEAAKVWVAGPHSPESLTELGKSLDVPADQVMASFQGLDGAALVARVAEHMPRGEVLEFALTALPTLPNGQAASAAALRDYLYVTYQPGQVWWTFVVIGAVSTVGMIGYDRWVRARVLKG